MRTAILIGSLALAAFVTAMAVLTPAHAAGWYVATAFGPNWDGESPLPFVNEETGLVGMVAVGTPISDIDGLRVELEASFRTHESTIGPLVLEHDTTAVMVNAVWDARGLAMGKLVPFIMAGAGVAHTELTLGGIGPLTVENDGFSFQLGGGANYALSENVSVGVRYNYLEAPAVELFGFELDGGSNHSVLLTAAVKFQ